MSRFYICNHCKNLVGVIHSSGVPIICCGEPMTEILPNTTEAATEKHLPVVEVSGNIVKATVGSAAHPMLPEHYIEWLYLETAHGGQRKQLKPGDAPEVTFAITDDDKPIAVYAYCNLHSLWKTEL